MNDQGETVPAAPARKSGDRRTRAFIFVFAFLVLSLLTGYRFLIGTSINDWYLFQVAKHVNLALTWIGESSRLEGQPTADKVSPAQARATLASRARDGGLPAQQEIDAASKEPLSIWERYCYRVGEARAAGRSNENLGPYVTYTLRAGASGRLRTAEEKLAQLRAGGGAADPSKKPAIEAAEQEVTQAREALQELMSLPPSQRDDSRVFSFNLVSSCGAIEVMAIYFSAVIAFPTLWRKRVIGLAAGLPLMYLLNVFRVTVLAMIGAWDRGGEIFNFVHHYLWQALYIVFVVVVWMSWIEFVVRGKEKA